MANFVEVLAGYGGFWIEPSTGSVGLDQAAAIASPTFLADTIRQGVSPQMVTSYGETESFGQFWGGKAYSCETGPLFGNEHTRLIRRWRDRWV